MTFKMEQELSIMAQSLATTSLLAELENAKFLKSEYFENLHFEVQDFKDILIESKTIGNPASMQMMLYALLVIPYELLDRNDNEELSKRMNIVNDAFFKVIEENDTYSTYVGEDIKSSIDYVRHIRNSVAHSRCEFNSMYGKNYVIFKDVFEDKQNRNYECAIKIECKKVGGVLEELQRVMLKYYNDLREIYLKSIEDGN